MQQARGLQNFISDLRNAPSKEVEQQRIDKELANIRQKFSNPGKLDAYGRKKYVWKMCYIHMLGYEVDFGHMEIVALISSPKYSEKSVGYVALSLLLKPGDEFMTLVVNSIRNDLVSQIPPAQNLALGAIANIGGADLAESLGQDVQRVVVDQSTEPGIRKKAVLCLLRLFRTSPETLEVVEWADRMASLLEDRHLGVVTSVMSLLHGLAQASPESYEGLVPYVIHILTRLVVQKACSADYAYYKTPSPWLQVKCLRFLSLYRAPDDSAQETRLNEALTKIITQTDGGGSVNKSNADHAVLFQAVNLIIHYGHDANERLRHQAMTLLGRFISTRDGNIRYLGLESMARLASLEGPGPIQKHQQTVLVSLKDADISVRKRALDVLFLICDSENGMEVVTELINHLAASDGEMKEAMVLKVAILAEKYAQDLRWYVDSMVQVISLAGDYVSDDIWHRIVQIVINHQDLQEYAAEKLFEVVQSKRAHEAAVCLGGYILGEFGFLIAEQPGKSGEDQFHALHQHFPNISVKARSLLLSSYIKLNNNFPELHSLIQPVFAKFSTSTNIEIQQRAVEYLALPQIGADAMEEVLKEMPPFPDNRESHLEQRLKGREHGGDKRSVTGRTASDADGSDTYSDDGSSAFSPGQAAKPASGPVDLLNLDEGPAPSSGPAIGLSADQVGELRGYFNHLVTSPQGILFQNNLVELRVQHEYRGSQGRLALHIVNCGTQEITNIQVDIPEVPHLKIQTQPPSVRAAISEQTTMQVAVECMQPFADAPEVHVAFTVGGQNYLYPLRLPIVATSFFEPAILDNTNFMQRWGALAGPEREVQEVFQAGKPITAEYMTELRQVLVQALRIGEGQGLDATPFTFTGAATFRTGTLGPDGVTKVSVGCMMRLEANAAANAFRITARAVHGRVAEGLRNVIKAQLA